MTAILAVVVGWNVLSNEVVPDWGYVPANLLVGLGLLVLGRRAGCGREVMGLAGDRLRRGLVVGSTVAAVIGLVVAVGALLPATRHYLVDDRLVGVSVPGLLYQTLVRIPLGTALFEELVFRGVLFGMFLRRRWSPLRAATVSSLLFGGWHVLPTLDVLESNPVGDTVQTPAATVLALVVTVLVFTVAGQGFVWLRLRGGGLLAPVLAHAASNTFAYAAGWLVVTRSWG